MNKHFCSQPMGYKKSKDGAVIYEHCDEKVTHLVKDSDWCVCKEHAAYYSSRGYELEKLKGD